MMELPETSEFRAFVTVVEAGSVSEAARELGVPRATVSRRLARLEEQLGVQLLRRTTRRMQLTDLGEELYGHARAIVGAVTAATAAVSQDNSAPRGPLRVSVPPSGEAGLHAMLLDFVVKYPRVQLEAIASSRHEDLISRNIDVAFRAGTDFDPSLIARGLMRSPILAVASPDYLKRRGHPSTIAELSEHDLLVGFARGERPATHWPLTDGDQIRVKPKLASNDVLLLREAAVAGLGIALMTQALCHERLQDGSLVPVLEDEVGSQTRVALVYADRKYLRPAVRAFIDHAAEWMKNDWP